MSTKNSIPASDSSSNPGTTDAGQCSMASTLQAASSSTAPASKPVDTVATVGIGEACPQGYSMSKGTCPILGLDGYPWSPGSPARLSPWSSGPWAPFEQSLKSTLATRADEIKGASLGYAIEGPDWLDPIDRQHVQVAGLFVTEVIEAFSRRWDAWALDVINQLSSREFFVRYPELGKALEEDRMGKLLQDAFDAAPVWSQNCVHRPVLNIYRPTLRVYSDSSEEVWEGETVVGGSFVGSRNKTFGLTLLSVVRALIKHHKARPDDPASIEEIRYLGGTFAVAYAMWHALRVIGFPLSPTPSDDRTLSSKAPEGDATGPIDAEAQVDDGAASPQASAGNEDDLILGVDGNLWRVGVLKNRKTLSLWESGPWALFADSVVGGVATREDGNRGMRLGFALLGPDWLDPIDRQRVQVAGLVPEATFKAFAQRWDTWADDIIDQLSFNDFLVRYPGLRAVLEKANMGPKLKAAFEGAPVWSQGGTSRPKFHSSFNGDVWDCWTTDHCSTPHDASIGSRAKESGVATMFAIVSLIQHYKKESSHWESSAGKSLSKGIPVKIMAFTVAYALWHALRVIGFPLSPTPSDDRTLSSKAPEGDATGPVDSELQAHDDDSLPTPPTPLCEPTSSSSPAVPAAPPPQFSAGQGPQFAVGMTFSRTEGKDAPSGYVDVPASNASAPAQPPPAVKLPAQPLEAPIFVEGVEGPPWQVGDFLDSKSAFLWGGICSANVHAASRVAPDGSIERGIATRLPFWCDEEDQKYVSVGGANQATVFNTSFRRLIAWGRGLIDLMGNPELLLYRHPMLHLLLADEGAGEKLQLAFRMAPIWRGLGVEPEPIDTKYVRDGWPREGAFHTAILPKSPGKSAQSPSLALALVKAIGSAIRAYKTKFDEANAKINLAKRQQISDLMLESDAFRLAYALSQALAAIGFRVSPPIVATAKTKGFFRDESGEEWAVIDHKETISSGDNDLGCCEIYKASSNTHGFEGVLIRGPRWLDDADQQQIQVAGHRSDIMALKFGAGLLRWLGQEQLFRDIEVRGGDTSDTSWQKLEESLLKRHPLLWCATKLCQHHGFDPKFHRGGNGSIGFFGRHEFVASAGKDVLVASCLAVRRLVRTVKEAGFTVLSFRLAYLLKEQERLVSNASESPALAASLAPVSPEAPPASPEAHAPPVSLAEPIQAAAEPAAPAAVAAAEPTRLAPPLVNWIQFLREAIVTGRESVLRNVAMPTPKPGQKIIECCDPTGTSEEPSVMLASTSEELAVMLADMTRKRTGALGAAVLASDAPAPDILVHENITPLLGEPPPMTFNIDPNKIDHAVLYTMPDTDFVALTTAVPFRAKEADGTLWVAKGDWTPIFSFEGDLQLFKAVSAGGKGDGFIVQGPKWITDKGDRIAVQAAGVDRDAAIEAAKVRLTVWAEGLALVFRHVELLEEMFPTLMRQLETPAIEKDFVLTLTRSWHALDSESPEDQISERTEWDDQVYPVLVKLKAGESTVSAEGRTQPIALFKAAIRLLRVFDFRKREKAQAILALSLAKALRAIGFPVHPLIVSDEGGFVADGWRFVDLKVTRKAESHLGFVPLVFAVYNSQSSTDGVLARGPAWMTEEEQRQVQVASTSREQAIGQIEETWKEWSCDLIRKVVGRKDIQMKFVEIGPPRDGVDFAKVPRRYHALNGVPAPVPVPKDAPARFVEIPMKWLRKDFPLLDRVMALANALAVSVGANVYEAWHPGATEPVYLLNWVVLGFLPNSFVEGSTVAEVVTEGLRTLVARLDRGAVGHAIAVRLAHEIFHFVKMQPEAWVSPHKIFEPGKGEEPAAVQKPAEPAPAAPQEVVRGRWVTGPVGPTGSAGSFGHEGPTGATVWTGPVRPDASAAPVPSETAPSSAVVEPKVTEAVDSMPIFTMPDAVRYHRVGDGRGVSAPSGEPRPVADQAPSAEPEATEEGAYRAGFKYGVDHPEASLDIQAKPLGLYPGNQDFRIAWEQGFLDERSARVLGHNTQAMSDAGIEAPSLLSPAVNILRLVKNYREVVEALGLPPSASHEEVISKAQQTLQPAKTIALEEAPLLPQEPVEAPPAAPVLRGVPGCDGREWLPEDKVRWQVSALAPWSRAEFYGQMHKAHAVVDGSMIPEYGFVIRGPGWLLDEDRFGLQVAGGDQQEVVRLYVERWKLWASQHLARVGGQAKVSEEQATKMFFLAYDKHGPTRRAIAIPSLDEVRASLLRQHEFETGVLCDGEEAGSSAT